MRRINLLQHEFLSHLRLRLRADFCFSIYRWNHTFNDWECIGHNNICSESYGLLRVSCSSYNCNRISDLIRNMSSILGVFNILISYIILSFCITVGEMSNDTELHRVCRVTSLSTWYDTSVVFLLSTCWDSVGFTIEASSNVTSLLKIVFLSFRSHIL